MQKQRVAILISGRGSNMARLIAAAAAPEYPAHIALIISDHASASGLSYALAHGIETYVQEKSGFPSREAYDRALHDKLVASHIDIVACAGFMRILSPAIVARWQGRMINIHPSLLPDYKGLQTHERVLADGAKIHGCTVHYVTAALDAGPIIAQAQVPVLAGDTAEDLAARVLVEEHRLYPKALAEVCHIIDKQKGNS